MTQNKIYYRWGLLLLGCLVVAGALGIGRFSYGILLPSLQDGLHLTHNETGLIASTNMVGYTLGTLLVGRIAFRLGSKTVISLSLLVIGITTAAVGFAQGIIAVILFRFLTGLSSAGAHISIMGLSSYWFSENRRGIANGFFMGGAGLPILLSGWMVPFITNIYPEQGWRYNWIILGLISILISFLTFAIIKNNLKEKILVPLGSKNDTYKVETPNSLYTTRDIINYKKIRFLALTFFCFGISYIIYATFFVNYLIEEKSIIETTAGDIWSLVGFLSIGSAVLWGSLSDKIGRSFAMTAVFLLQVVSYLLVASTIDIKFMWISAIIFGLTAWSIPGIIASYCSDLLGPRNATKTLGLVTFFFSVGSVIGPAIAGQIKEISTTFTLAFYFAAFFALMGGIFSLFTGNCSYNSIEGVCSKWSE